jgi:hypothetical protein
VTLTLENINEATRDELRAFAKAEKLSGYTTLKVDGLRELVRIELERREEAHKVIDKIADESLEERAAWKQRMFAIE